MVIVYSFIKSVYFLESIISE